MFNSYPKYNYCNCNYHFNYPNSNIEYYKDNNDLIDLTAVIVEPREHKALPFVLKNVLENLPSNSKIMIFHGNKNLNYIKKNIKEQLKKYENRIILNNLNVDNLDILRYNKLLTSADFYKKIPTEMFLIFQTDSMICSENKNNLKEFMKYDYVGAPWRYRHDRVGNGGFSLRRKSKILEYLIKCPYGGSGGEDGYFADGCSKMKLNVPNLEDAKKFASETYESKNPYGIHKAWNYIDNGKMEKMCRNSTKLRDLNK